MAELADELGVQTDTVIDTDPDGFESVLQSFKKGIHEQIGPDECDARYDLAIAYKEMGLVDDAIENLELAIQGGARQVEALSLLASCKLELGKPVEAVIHLEMALLQATEGDEATMSLHLRARLRAARLRSRARGARRVPQGCGQRRRLPRGAAADRRAREPDPLTTGEVR